MLKWIWTPLCRNFLRIVNSPVLSILISRGLLTHLFVDIVCTCCPFLCAIFLLHGTYLVCNTWSRVAMISLSVSAFKFHCLPPPPPERLNNKLSVYVCRIGLFRVLPQNSEPPCVFPAVNVVIIRDKPHLKLGTLFLMMMMMMMMMIIIIIINDMHLTPSSNSPTLDIPPHIVTVNAAAARSTACFCCYISKHFFCYTLLFTTLFF